MFLKSCQTTYVYNESLFLLSIYVFLDYDLKEMNRLLSKEMSNIYLKVTIEKNWRSLNLDFLSLKNLSPGQFRELQILHILLNFKTSCRSLKIKGLVAKLCVRVCFFLLLLFWKVLWHFKVRAHVFRWAKIHTLIITKRNQKWKIIHTV